MKVSFCWKVKVLLSGQESASVADLVRRSAKLERPVVPSVLVITLNSLNEIETER
jgi:hypothetical protein